MSVVVVVVGMCFNSCGSGMRSPPTQVHTIRAILAICHCHGRIIIIIIIIIIIVVVVVAFIMIFTYTLTMSITAIP